MAQKKKTKKAKKKNNRTKKLFWVMLILFIAPFAVLGWILISAAMDTGSPILGQRYEGDLDPAITKTDMDQIKSGTEAISGVESVDVELATGTLRVYADIDDNATAETADNTADQIYTVVSNVLDPGIYFTQADGKKMYDLEIHVYNYGDDSKRDSDSFVYVIDTKTSSMPAPVKQLVSQPVNTEVAEQLRQDVENRKHPTPSPSAGADSNEMNLGGEDIPQSDLETDVQTSDQNNADNQNSDQDNG